MRFIPPPVLALMIAVLMWAVARAWPELRCEWPAAHVLAVLLVLVALALMVGAVFELARARTTVNPLRPERSSALVTRGVFAWTRNPIYLGDVLMLAAWAMWLGHPVAAVLPALFVLWIDRVQIRAEEDALARRFGAAFEAYRRSVRRWV